MRRVVFIAVAVVAAGCASSSSSTTTASAGTDASTSGRPFRRGSADFITESEIQASSASNAYQAIEMLRPQMLVGRGTASPNDRTGETSQPKAYIDEVPLGSIANLRGVPIGQVKEIRFINGRDATTRWGTGHIGGVILVSTRK